MSISNQLYPPDVLAIALVVQGLMPEGTCPDVTSEDASWFATCVDNLMIGNDGQDGLRRNEAENKQLQALCQRLINRFPNTHPTRTPAPFDIPDV